MTDIDGRDLISPRAYAERGVPHDQWTELRRLDHLHSCEPRGFDAFYPVVRHRDVCEISRRPDLFRSRFGIVLEGEQQKVILRDDSGLGKLCAIITMDPPEHPDYRKVAAPRFTPRAIRRVDPVARESARSLVDRLVETPAAERASASSRTRSRQPNRSASSRRSWACRARSSPGVRSPSGSTRASSWV